MTGGAYLVFTEVPKREIYIKIGKLGTISFKRGVYCYIGSAMSERGSTSLEKRVFRHVKSALLDPKDENSVDSAKNSIKKGKKTKKTKKPKKPKKPKKHWHIDYFLADPRTVIKKAILIPSKKREECLIAAYLTKYADNVINKFGCSDCKCVSHLLFFKKKNLIIEKIFN
ncbi:MAG: GIY-YIG nuclease family protein [Promethearchaeota archaeon]